MNEQWFELSKTDVQSLAQTSGNNSVAGAVSPEDIKKTLDIYHQHAFIKADKTYADEVVDGKNSAHFSIKLDRNQYIAFLQAVKSANLKTITVSDDDIAKAKNVPETVQDGSLEVWVTRDARKLKQVKFVSTKKGQEAAVTFTLTDKLPTFDTFAKPANTKPISQFLTIMLGGSLSPAELNAIEMQSAGSAL